MSDLLSPLLVVAGGDEAEAFAAFACLMGRLEANFHADQRGMHSQLMALRRLVQVRASRGVWASGRSPTVCGPLVLCGCWVKPSIWRASRIKLRQGWGRWCWVRATAVLEQ